MRVDAEIQSGDVVLHLPQHVIGREVIVVERVVAEIVRRWLKIMLMAKAAWPREAELVVFR